MNEVDVDELRREIRLILKDADLNSLSSKKVRQMLENHFHRDFTERKKEIDQILMDEITKTDSIPSDDHQQHQREEEEEEEEESVRCDPSSSFSSNSTSNNEVKTKMKSKSNDKRRIQQSDEELAMIIHHEENRPSLRHSRPMKYSSTSTSTSTSTRTSHRRKTGEKRKNSYNKDLQLSDQLANVVGGEKMPRSEVVKRMWIYFKEHQLMDPQNKQFVNCDDKLTKLFGRKRIRAFGMLKDLARHMSDPDKQ